MGMGIPSAIAKGHIKVLLASTMLVSFGAAGAAFAQAQGAGSDVLGEVVVTATRQTDTVNRVPLSITAETQRTLDQQGVKKIDDLARTVPGLNIQRATTSGDASVNIRGISSPVGAPTAGFYLDDTPLTKRNGGNGILYGVNGAPTPQIFDLERVEVLRGPQGTLFGGSSEGGNIRYITPTPSLTRYSTYARAEVSTTEGGGPSAEAGVAVGGPIVQDKLGFRGSVWIRHTGGYIDHVDEYTGKTIAENTNSGEAHNLRAAFLWAPTDYLRITPALFYSFDRVADNDVWWENIPAYHTNGTTFTNSGTINGVKYAFNPVVFPAFNDGPYNMFGPFKTGTNDYTDTNGNSHAAKSPRKTTLLTPSLTADVDLGGGITAHNSLAYIQDNNTGFADGRFAISTIVSNAELTTGVTGNCGQTTGVLNTSACQPIRLPGDPNPYQLVTTTNRRKGWTEELRISSAPDAKPISWVAGVFFEDSQIHVMQQVFGNTESVAQFFHGIYEPYITGVRALGPNGLTGITSSGLKEREYAGFGEVNYFFTAKLKATAGVRVSHDEFHYLQQTGGQVTGAPAGFVGTVADPFPDNFAGCPSSTDNYNPANATNGCPFTYTNVTDKETPITPKFGLSYQADPNSLYYLTAAKGYRPGGINPPVSAIVCAVDFAALNITQVPQQFSSDSLWSYEGGAKLRLFGKAQVNASLFYIDWKNVQTNARLSNCGRTYTVNGASAVSKGGDVQVEAKVYGGFSVSGTVAYTDAYYNASLLGVGGGNTPPQVLTKGEPLPNNSKWEYTLGAQYAFEPTPTTPAYVRVDYQYKSPYYTGAAPTDVGYTPFSYKQSQTFFVTARAGVTVQGAEVSVFVNNLTNSRDPLVRGQAGATALFTDITFRPREFGLQIAYRH